MIKPEVLDEYLNKYYVGIVPNYGLRIDGSTTIYVDYFGYAMGGIRTYIFTMKKTDSYFKYKRINEVYRHVFEKRYESVMILLLEEVSTSLLYVPEDFIKKLYSE